jgi:hypothetical protein
VGEGAIRGRRIFHESCWAALRSQTLLSWNAAPPNGAIESVPVSYSIT